MTPSGLISLLLALRRGLPAASALITASLRLSRGSTSASPPNYFSIERWQAKKKEARPQADTLSGCTEPVITAEQRQSQVSSFHRLCKDALRSGFDL